MSSVLAGRPEERTTWRGSTLLLGARHPMVLHLRSCACCCGSAPGEACDVGVLADDAVVCTCAAQVVRREPARRARARMGRGSAGSAYCTRRGARPIRPTHAGPLSRPAVGHLGAGAALPDARVGAAMPIVRQGRRQCRGGAVAAWPATACGLWQLRCCVYVGAATTNV